MGKASSYEWIRIGGSYLLSDVLASLVYTQFKKIEIIHKKRRRIALWYINELNDLKKNIWFPSLQIEKETNWHTFAICVPGSYQMSIISELKKRGIGAAFHYLPLHSSFYGKKLGYKKSDLPITNEVSSTLIRLPIYPSLTK